MKLLVSGTDTGIGKTVVTCAVLHALHAQGISTLGMKPVVAGVNALGEWDDVNRIFAASTFAAALDDVAPYRLRAAASPHFAAAEEGVAIQTEVILAALDSLESLAEIVVIEGVGGFRVPLSDRLDSANLAQAIGAPLLLVVPMRLGCINHALLTAEAIVGRGLSLLGWVANAGIDAHYPRVAETVDAISDRIRAPCLGVLPKLVPGQNGADRIAIDRLLAGLRHSSFEPRRPA